MNSLWNQLAIRANVTLTQHQHDLFNRYLDLLSAGNEQMNLTRITDRESAEIAHIGDALTVLPYLPAVHGLRLADVGSGGGVPGVPLAIARPDTHVALIESTKKKAKFLTDCVQAISLSNVTVIGERVEDVGHDPKYREGFDVAACRAVATLDWLCEWCLPLVKKGGKLLAMKGAKAAEELPLAEHAIALVGGSRPDVHPVELPGTHSHVIVEITKIHKTSRAYPRPPSIAKGESL